MAKILIVDDEKAINDFIKFNLELVGHDCNQVYDGNSGLSEALKSKYDLIILDVMLPYYSGFEIMEYIEGTPVIFVTAKSTPQDKIKGLRLGADDYITKPFNPLEVQARVRSQLRRYTNLGGMEKAKTTLTVGGIELDDEIRKVTMDGEAVSLTPLEDNILKLLMESPGRVYSSAEIYRSVWNEAAYGADSAVDDLNADFLVGQLFQRSLDCFHGTLYVSLDDQVQGLHLAFLHTAEQIVQSDLLHHHGSGILGSLLALFDQFSCHTLVGNGIELVAGSGNFSQTGDLNGNGGTCGLDGTALVVGHDTDTAHGSAGDDDVALVQSTVLHQQSGNRTTGLVQTGLDNRTLCATVGVCLQFLHLSGEDDHFQQFIQTLVDFLHFFGHITAPEGTGMEPIVLVIIARLLGPVLGKPVPGDPQALAVRFLDFSVEFPEPGQNFRFSAHGL